MFYFYLNEPLTRDKFRSIYEEIGEKCPYLESTQPLEIMTETSFGSRYDSSDLDPFPCLKYDNCLEISLYNGKSNERNEEFQTCRFDLRSGERQLMVDFESRWLILTDNIVEKEPHRGWDLLEFLKIVTRHTDPFFGLFSSELHFYGDGGYDINFMKRLIGNYMGSFYVDSKLANNISIELLEEVATYVVPVGELGHFVIVGGIPMAPAHFDEDDGLVRTIKVFEERISPKVIRRLVNEYKYRENTLGIYR
jgi:hypothetical protein